MTHVEDDEHDDDCAGWYYDASGNVICPCFGYPEEDQ
jgi:hypothetical protein